MRTIDTCRHCGYRIPSDAAICPGCGRRHPVRVRPLAPVPPEVRRRHAPLLRRARGTRWLLALTAWVAAAFAVGATASYVVGLEDVAEDLDEDVPGRVADVAHAVGLGTAAALGLAVAATIIWSRRAHRNLRDLEVASSWTSGWSLGGWLVPGRKAKAEKRAVDALWRDSSPVLANLPHRGWSRRPVSRVVLHWWTLWLAVPAAGLLAGSLGPGAEDLRDERAVAGVAGAALLVAAVRALYDVVGLVTVAQAHRAEAVLRDRVDTSPWSDEDAGWADASPESHASPESPTSPGSPAAADLEPLRG